MDSRSGVGVLAQHTAAHARTVIVTLGTDGPRAVELADALGALGAGPPRMPEGQTPQQQVNPQELAQRALDSMTLLGPDIASPRAAGKPAS
ncbi:hypothetical protein ACFYRN_44310 [Streptomyces sp. NPDC005227]|uniref:hypothetical protein n=1 Tax=Streptomyces sp. NPDC005227 TaxID=3364707 RepID=UPI0036B9DDE2